MGALPCPRPELSVSPAIQPAPGRDLRRRLDAEIAGERPGRAGDAAAAAPLNEPMKQPVALRPVADAFVAWLREEAKTPDGSA
ncbi:hypothetical protein M673_22950 (plasmid) [Aureimonas sp. AU20]|nr:hypothetical protein M673_22950 [Aureimonas sp. AU20]